MAAPGTVLVYAIWDRKPPQGGPAVLVGHNGVFAGEKGPSPKHARDQQRVYKTPAIQTKSDAMTVLDSRIQSDIRLQGMQYVPTNVQEKQDAKGDFFTFRLLVPDTDLTFPKGGIEAGETPEEAAVREFEEETSLAIDKARLVPATKSPAGIKVFKVVLTDTEAAIVAAQPGKIHRDLFMPHWVDISSLIPSMFNKQSESAITAEAPKAGGKRLRRTGRNKLDTKKGHMRSRARKTRRIP